MLILGEKKTKLLTGTTSSEPLLPSWSRQEVRFPCFVWKAFPTFLAHDEASLTRKF